MNSSPLRLPHPMEGDLLGEQFSISVFGRQPFLDFLHNINNIILFFISVQNKYFDAMQSYEYDTISEAKATGNLDEAEVEAEASTQILRNQLQVYQVFTLVQR